MPRRVLVCLLPNLSLSSLPELFALLFLVANPPASARKMLSLREIQLKIRLCGSFARECFAFFFPVFPLRRLSRAKKSLRVALESESKRDSVEHKWSTIKQTEKNSHGEITARTTDELSPPKGFRVMALSGTIITADTALRDDLMAFSLFRSLAFLSQSAEQGKCVGHKSGLRNQ
jgi:hypothetical protein